ncbi:methyltransferase domain-containing protein [Virgibacillus dakarensis]|uniref:class I SAM-dependent methyltransferase n=1 Tax=Virgibacillus dakarensis TaxID=1917889 RepID=UPI000B431470|nr:class I SAM-dependent methyltransferase [Virgibacillus dakarensis]MBT2214747.1 methyltransferase domain-containing protein [Virgibacillus dakarensis]MTW85581.1 methyltransferase domain-containing protein [Virgibacillus dakarensis]
MPAFNWEKEAETQWDDRAHFWNKHSTGMWDSGSRKNIIPFIQKHLNEMSSILDIGCGDGYGSYKLLQSGYNVTGMDLSSEMIQRAKVRVPANEINFLQGNVMNLPFKDQHFDGVMAINILEWTEIPAKALSELKRVVKMDGLLCIGLLGPTAGPRTNSYPRVYGKDAICNTMMPWEFLQLASEYNLEYVDGFGVYKEDVKGKHHEGLPIELKQALSFMWVFMLRKTGEDNG